MASYSMYNEGLLMDGADSDPVARRRWFNAALIGGSSLLLLGIVATSISTPSTSLPDPFRISTPYSKDADESTNLVGFRSMQTPGLRGGAAMNPMQAQAYTRFGSNPLAKLAISAIDATNRGFNRGNGMRDVSMMALMDAFTKNSKLKQVSDDVAAKARNMAGVTKPLGFFDPLGFSAQLSEGQLLFYREVELKHGRIAMLAALGILVGEQFHPLFGGNIDTAAYKAFQETPLETFWPAVVTAIAIPEIFSIFTFNQPSWKQTPETQFWSMKSDHEPGNLGFDPLGLKPTDPEKLKDMQTKELNNGRLAMIAAAGMIAQEVATGQKLF